MTLVMGWISESWTRASQGFSLRGEMVLEPPVELTCQVGGHVFHHGALKTASGGWAPLNGRAHESVITGLVG